MKAPQPLSRYAVAVALAGAMAACDDGSPLSTAHGPGAAGARLHRAGADAIPGRYIVVLREGGASASAEDVADRALAAHGGTVHATYGHALQGFAASLPAAAVNALLNDPSVAFIAEDAVVRISETQTGATWGLDRIDQRDLPLNGAYTYRRMGIGTHMYILDTGIRLTHREFAGRIGNGFDAVTPGGSADDCNGHGTHVAGTAGGATYGVARATTLHPVRVLGCGGSSDASTLIEGLDWVAANHVKPAVANLSLGAGANAAVDAAVDRLVAAGVTVVVAAGNEARDACLVSPARAARAITVGGTTSADARNGTSNWGTCLDIFAPGTDITSAWFSGDDASLARSGTSMASPHVAGVAALYLQGRVSATPAQVWDAIRGSASGDRLTGLGTGSPNLLVYSPLAGDDYRLSATAVTFSKLNSRAPGPMNSGGWPAGDLRGATQKVFVKNLTAAPLEWTATADRDWFSVSPAAGTLAAGDSVALRVVLDEARLAGGSHSGTVVVVANLLAARISVTAHLTEVVTLASGQAQGGISASAGVDRYYRIEVPPGADSLRVEMNAPTGDADLYVRRGALPTLNDWDCRPYENISVETCTLPAPAAGTYYVMVGAWRSYALLTLQATVFTPAPLPAPPGNVRSTIAGTRRIDVRWVDASSRETGYRLYREALGGDAAWGAPQQVASVGENRTMAPDTSGLVEGTTYRYQVQACNAAGCTSSAYSAAVAFEKPGAPTAPTAGPGSVAGTVELTWGDASHNEVSFRVLRGRRSTGGGWTGFTEVGRTAADATSYVNSGVAPGTYRYQIRACNAVGCNVSTTTAPVTLP